MPDGPPAPRLAEPPARPLTAARRPHLVGVGGTGMSSLATLLVGMGAQVSGCDAARGPTLAWLADRGVRVASGHDVEHVAGADLLVVSAAIAEDHPERVAATERGLSVITHAQALGALMATRRGVAVAGTHGKSTTTALVAHVLATAGRDPTLVGGAVALDFGASSRLGHGPELVAEADEYGRRFLELHPDVAVITGIEPDHLDYYGDFNRLVEAFDAFVGGMAPDGVVVTHEDGGPLSSLALARRRIRYGSSAGDWVLRRYEPILGGGCTFDVRGPTGERRRYRSNLTGRHNAENALAAVVVANLLGVPDDAIRRALASFRGTRRRFETRLRANGVWIVDDYAHHPTAVAATLRAARDAHHGPIWAVFQPHTAHRTASLLDEFAAAFEHADHVLVTPIYRPTGREAPGPAVTAEDLVARMHHRDARAVASLDEARAQLEVAFHAEPAALILTLGAGDVTTLADRLVERAGTTG